MQGGNQLKYECFPWECKDFAIIIAKSNIKYILVVFMHLEESFFDSG